jgi:hypothetical protein
VVETISRRSPVHRIQVGKHDAGTGGRQPLGNRLSDERSATRDNGNLAVELTHGYTPTR